MDKEKKHFNVWIILYFIGPTILIFFGESFIVADDVYVLKFLQYGNTEVLILHKITAYFFTILLNYFPSIPWYSITLVGITFYSGFLTFKAIVSKGSGLMMDNNINLNHVFMVFLSLVIIFFSFRNFNITSSTGHLY